MKVYAHKGNSQSAVNVTINQLVFLSCAEVWAPMSANTFSLVLIIGGYIIPLIIIAFVYSLAGIRLWSRQLPGHRNLVSNKKAQSSSRRATAMLITVVIVFALSWLPFQALEMLRQYNRPLYKSLPIEFLFTTPWFGYANSAINPILYVIFSENYRKEFYRILCRGPSRKDRNRKAVIEGVRAQREQPKCSERHYTSTHSIHCLPADVPQNFDSPESGLPANKQRTLDSSARSLAVDTAPTCESSKSRLASNIPLTGESSEQPSSLGLDKPLTQKSHFTGQQGKQWLIVFMKHKLERETNKLTTIIDIGIILPLDDSAFFYIIQAIGKLINVCCSPYLHRPHRQAYL